MKKGNHVLLFEHNMHFVYLSIHVRTLLKFDDGGMEGGKVARSKSLITLAQTTCS